MGRANILNTRTIDYLELIGNGKRYLVPPYQRDYSWSEEQWEDLWNDIVDLQSAPDDRHYLGALVVEARGDREFLIIDGQQRLATLSLFALAVIARLHRMADGGVEPESNQERARQDFTGLSVSTAGRRRKLAKYILARLETDASGRDCDPAMDSGTIEHILPENPADTWREDFDPRRWDDSIYRLGNLTLLESCSNRHVGNAVYEDKLGAYGQSRYALSRQIPDIAPEQWTPELVERRQEQMAARAVHVWRSDFA